MNSPGRADPRVPPDHRPAPQSRRSKTPSRRLAMDDPGPDAHHRRQQDGLIRASAPGSSVQGTCTTARAPEICSRARRTTARAPESCSRVRRAKAEAPETCSRAGCVTARAPESCSEGSCPTPAAPDNCSRGRHPTWRAPENRSRNKRATPGAPENCSQDKRSTPRTPENCSRGRHTTARVLGNRSRGGIRVSAHGDAFEAPDHGVSIVSYRCSRPDHRLHRAGAVPTGPCLRRRREPCHPITQVRRTVARAPQGVACLPQSVVRPRSERQSPTVPSTASSRNLRRLAARSIPPSCLDNHKGIRRKPSRGS